MRQIVIPSDVPAYEQLNPQGFFADDCTLYPEGEVLVWDGTPNEYMKPLNAPARERMEAFLKELDGGAMAVAKKYDRPYTGRITDLADQVAQGMADAKEDFKRNMGSQVQSLEKRNTPLTTGGKRRGRPPKVRSLAAPEQESRPDPKASAIMGKPPEVHA